MRRPASYTIDGGGVWERDEKDNLVRVTHAPLVMTGRSRDMRTGAEFRTITFRASGASRAPWREIDALRVARQLDHDGIATAPIPAFNT